MNDTTKLIISMATVGIALGGMILVTTNNLRVDMRELRNELRGEIVEVRRDVHALSDRVSRLEGLMQGVLASRVPAPALARAPERDEEQ